MFVFYHFWAEANIFRVSENKVQEAVINIRSYYFISLHKKSAVVVGPTVLTPVPAPNPTPNPKPKPEPKPEPKPASSS